MPASVGLDAVTQESRIAAQARGCGYDPSIERLWFSIVPETTTWGCVATVDQPTMLIVSA